MTDRARELVEKLPSKALFCHGTIPEPLSAECRQWLVDQLHSYPKRVNEDRTCAIGALTEMATTEFCRLMAEQSLTPPEGDTVSEGDEAYEIGKRDGYDKAIQDLDLLTGGDGEYCYVIGAAHDRHCPDAETMKRRIADRFAALQSRPTVSEGVVERVARVLHDDALARGETGSRRSWEKITIEEREGFRNLARAYFSPPSAPEHLSRRKMVMWQPIETAPRDGTVFLAYEEGNYYALEWVAEMPDDGYWKSHCGQYVTITPEPTHWMPLPSPPESEA